MFTIIGGDGREYGPASVAQLRSWIAAGRANLDTKAKALGTEEWRRLGDFAEFSELEAPPPLPVTPPAIGVTATVASPASLPSRWLRLLAALIDGILRSLCMIPTMSVFFGHIIELAQSGQQPDPTELMHVIQSAFVHSIPYLLVLALVQCALLATRGQSIGKLICGLRIVRYRDAAPAGFVHAVLLRSFVPTVIDQIPLLGALFWIVDTCFIFSDEKRCVHDLIADTKVVSAKLPA